MEVINWWQNGGEREALGALIDVHEASHPSATVVSTSLTTGSDARATIRERMLGLAPPDVYQANVGHDLLTWAVLNEADDSESKLRPLSAPDVVGRDTWTEVFPEPVVAQLGVSDQVYGVPINIHRINSLFYNRHVLESLDLDPPTSLDELYAVADAIEAHNAEQAADERIIPLVVSGGEAWTVSLLFFENLLIARAGTEFYLSYFSGNEAGDAPAMMDALEEAERLWAMVVRNDPAARRRSWSNAVEQVARGRAAMIVMGDWAKGSLQSEPYALEPGADFGQLPFPGTQGTFVYTADCFAAPRGSAAGEAAIDWLRTAASIAGQRAFNPLKGSIPARTDGVDETLYDELSRATLHDFQHDTLAPALSALAPARWSDAVNARLGELLVQERFEADELRFVLLNYYDVF